MATTIVYFEGQPVFSVTSDDPTLAARLEASYAEREYWIRDPGPHDMPVVKPTHFSVTCTLPRDGWIEMIIAYDHQEVKLWNSQFQDPFEQIRDWLEKLVRGEYAYVYYPAEGTNYRLSADKDPNLDFVLFTVWSDTHERRCEFCLRLRRLDLVHAIYGSLVDIWEKPDVDTFWLNWVYGSWRDEEDDEDVAYGVYYYHIRSSIIDAYLASAPT